MARKANKYRITYYVNGKKKTITALSAAMKNGMIRDMKSGRWSDTYSRITSKKLSK